MLKCLNFTLERVKKRFQSKHDMKEEKELRAIRQAVPEGPEPIVFYRELHHKITTGKSDVVLDVDGKSFKLHRNVLAASAKFFQVMFSTDMKERNMEEIQLKGIESCVFQTLIQFMYTGEIQICDANAEKLWITSDYLEMIFIRNAAANFLTEQLMNEIRSEKNNRSFYDVLEIRERANLMGCSQLSNAANKFIAFNLKYFMYSDEFLTMNFDEFLNLIKCDDLIVHCTKEATLEACMSWIEYDKEERLSKKEEILTLMHSREHNSRKIFVFEGENGSMEIYDLIKEEWKKSYDCPGLLYGNNVAVVKGRIYLVGDSTLEYQINKKWSRKNKMETPRSSTAVAVLEDIIYVCGGYLRCYDYPVVDSVECYDPSKDIWKTLTPMIERRQSACAVALDGFIYVLGGSQNGINVINSVERFDRKENSWMLVKPMIHKRRDFGATVFQGKIYVAGGIDDNFRILNSVEIYDPKEDSWVEGPSMNLKRVFLTLLSADKLFAIGGISNRLYSYTTNTALNSIEIFDPKTNLWKYGNSMLTKKYNHVAVAVP